jgi:hypothetical protein
MSVSAVSLYQRTRRYLRDYRDFDSITTAITTTSATSVVVADTTIYAARWPIEIDQETMIVKSITNATTMVVERGAYGSTAATHLINAPILINPAFYGVEILDALNEGIQACYPLIYKRVIDTSVTIAANTWEYTVPNMPGTYNGDTIQIPRIGTIEIQEPGVVPYFPTAAWSLRRGAEGGHKIKFQNLETTGAIVRISGIGSFPDLADYTSNLDTSFPKQAIYLPSLYAAASLLMSGEAGRVRLTAGAVDTREQANRVGSSMSAGQNLMNRFLFELNRSSMEPPRPRIKQRP